MAKKAKGNRVQVILECTEMKNSGLPGTSRYVTTKNRKNTPDRMELMKYNPILKKRIAVPIVAYVMNRGQVQCKTGNRETFINGLAPLVKQGSGHNKQQPVFALIPKLADDQQGFIRFTQRTLVTQNNAFQIR